MMETTSHPAQECEVAAWLNAPGPVTLAALRGKVVAVYAFQMLCPGCVAHALPQARELGKHFGSSELAVLGLHTVAEHDEAMNECALAAFLHEYRIGFPVGVDRRGARWPGSYFLGSHGRCGHHGDRNHGPGDHLFELHRSSRSGAASSSDRREDGRFLISARFR